MLPPTPDPEAGALPPAGASGSAGFCGGGRLGTSGSPELEEGAYAGCAAAGVARRVLGAGAELEPVTGSKGVEDAVTGRASTPAVAARVSPADSAVGDGATAGAVVAARAGVTTVAPVASPRGLGAAVANLPLPLVDGAPLDSSTGPTGTGWLGTTTALGNTARVEMLPCTSVSPSDSMTTCPPLGPLASITLDGLSTTDCLARRVTVPLSPTAALLACMVPLLRTRAP